KPRESLARLNKAQQQARGQRQERHQIVPHAIGSKKCKRHGENECARERGRYAGGKIQAAAAASLPGSAFAYWVISPAPKQTMISPGLASARTNAGSSSRLAIRRASRWPWLFK